MIVRTAKIISLLMVFMTGSSVGEVLHTLASPNEEDHGYFGSSISGVGDLNGDGYPDVVVGAPLEDPGSSPMNAGRAYVFDGQTAIRLHTLISPNEQAFGNFGCSVSGVKNSTPAGYPDIIVGASWEGGGPSGPGRAYLFDGHTGDRLYNLLSPNGASGGNFGCSVAGAGDINNDGYDDFVIGASGESFELITKVGRAYAFNGRTGNPLHTFDSPNLVYEGWFGAAVSGAGDVNDDGFDDVVVGAHAHDPGGSPDKAGRAYVFDGQTGSVLLTLVSPNEEFEGRFGASVSGAGDVNGDGYDDLIVGAHGEGPEGSPDKAGRAYVFDGQTGNELFTLASPNEESEGRFGLSVSGMGDIDGNGYADVVVGAPGESPGSSPEDAGRAYVFDGHTGELLYTLASPNEESSGVFGTYVSGTGNINGIPYDDVFVTGFEDPGSSPDHAGRAYIFSWMHLIPSITGGALELQWSKWPPASEYWIYGTSNLPWFAPGSAPGFQYRLTALPSSTTTWSSLAGVGDPDDNWTYLVMAVDSYDQELARSNRVGECDWSADIP